MNKVGRFIGTTVVAMSCFFAVESWASAETGYDLWLRYIPVADTTLLAQYRSVVTGLLVEGDFETSSVIRTELITGLDGLLNMDIPIAGLVDREGLVVAGTPDSSPVIDDLGWDADLSSLGADGYLIRSAVMNGKNVTVIASQSETGALYGVFHFLRLIQTEQSIGSLNISDKPRIKLRMLNHWDDLNGHVERGYAGSSLWQWDELPGTLDPRYTDYARANASLGINGTVLNNVNADSVSLSTSYLQKTAALADVFRPYGIQVFLTSKFSAPIDIGGLNTTDPLDENVITFWQNKADEIYRLIPDFGGFLIKANSEGQPGPQDYGRTHADGASMLAAALAPHGGVVAWRAFVYNDTGVDSDRAKRPYKEFIPFDGQFATNVFIQAKNGPLDFQPREVPHPLFGGMPNTRMAAELQITQEYLGRSTHLVYLAPMWKEFLSHDTYAKGPGSTIDKIIDGSVSGYSNSMIAGVANIGSDPNWCGHHFAQANWYAFGRLAWNPDLTSEEIADEWIRMTWSNDSEVVTTLKEMMLPSWRAVVNYMSPLGLHFTASKDHYTPDPARRNGGYIYADSSGIGTDRTRATGSDAVEQFFSPLREKYDSIASCPEDYLLWFHHAGWGATMKSGRTLWNELCFLYYDGVLHVTDMKQMWGTLQPKIDTLRFSEVESKLSTQETDAIIYRDTCVNYFQGHSNLPIPSSVKTMKLKTWNERH